MSWSLSGTILIACNCDWGCPCNVNGRPTEGHCEGGWTWHVETGSFGDVSLDGLSFSVFADWPGAIHEGGGQAVAFVDEQAGDEQLEALRTIVRGDAGGPWSLFIATYELSGPHPAPYEVVLDGDRSRYRIGDVAELELEPITNPVSGAEIHPRLILPEGLVTDEAALLSSRRFAVRDGIAYDHSGRYGAVGPFAYSG
jgi:hypothetical protein